MFGKIIEMKLIRIEYIENAEKKGKRIFNEEWRDLHLAFINGLKKDDRIEIALTSNFILDMPIYPEIYRADFGYFDPKDKSRHGLLTMYDFEEDNFEEND